MCLPPERTEQWGDGPGCGAPEASGPMRRRGTPAGLAEDAAAAEPTMRRKGIQEIYLRGTLGSRDKVQPPFMPESPPHASWTWPRHAGPCSCSDLSSLLSPSRGVATALSLQSDRGSLPVPPLSGDLHTNSG